MSLSLFRGLDGRRCELEGGGRGLLAGWCDKVRK